MQNKKEEYDLSHYRLELNSTTYTTIASKVDGCALFLDRFDSHFGVTQKNKGHTLFILHGFGEHGARYRHFAHYLGDVYERFFTMDQRGHGRSSGTRGDMPSFETLLEDLKIVLEYVKKQEPENQKISFFCHSFGGLVGLHYLIKEKNLPFDCAIISSPQLGLKMEVPKFLELIASVLNKTLRGIQLVSNINPQNLSHDPKNTDNYVNDKLVHTKITPRTFFEMKKAMEFLQNFLGSISLPLLFITAGDDKIVDTKQTKDFFERIKNPDKKYIEYPNFYHEVVNEVERNKVFQDIIEFVLKVRSK
jgi:lysophospholipase